MKGSRNVYDWLVRDGNAAVGGCSCGLEPWEENATVVIYCGNDAGHLPCPICEIRNPYGNRQKGKT